MDVLTLFILCAISAIGGCVLGWWLKENNSFKKEMQELDESIAYGWKKIKQFEIMTAEEWAPYCRLNWYSQFLNCYYTVID
ncbi:hypothetical protein M0R19_04950 [Candidatus Pacearchaeota archaeon]|jgi:drug/metabolite transporter superfamily protein YnfA|nr:hypothetical protein [Candidatus Pacearchaeota archaeon]